MLPSHRRAMEDIENCRTEALGGHVYRCPACETERYSYHSCKNRHCPKCQGEAGQAWLQRQEKLRLPTPYFLLTFTLPEGMRWVARRNQKLIYNLLFRASAQATQQLARDGRFMGGQIGMIGVLHTWARDLSYHPHVHYLALGGGWDAANGNWVESRKDYFLPVKALGKLFRGKFCAGLQKAGLLPQAPKKVWSQDWVVHCLPVGNGVRAMRYLAPYILRVALTNRRIVRLEGGRVTYTYRDSGGGETRTCTMEAERFIQRFLQHVLPRGFVKVRYYGFFSAGKRRMLQEIRRLLGMTQHAALAKAQSRREGNEMRCPCCGGRMRMLRTLQPQSRMLQRPPPGLVLPEAA